jgi:hypothetical protein
MQLTVSSVKAIAYALTLGLIPTLLAVPHCGEHHYQPQLANTSMHPSVDRTIGTVLLDSHVEYSSSTGVIGCLIDTNRVAYWPGVPPCDDPCIRLAAPNGRTIHVLHIDQSQGSFDISMDAFKTLKYGPGWRSINTQPESKWDGVQYEYVSMKECAGILPNGTLPVVAKSPNKYIECARSEPQSFWATSTQLYDIDDPGCLRGLMQTCELLDLDEMPKCENGNMAGFSIQAPLTGVDTVVDITASGESVPAIRPVH